MRPYAHHLFHGDLKKHGAVKGLRDRWMHMIPGLCAGREDIPSWPIQGRIVKTSRLQIQIVW
jgi:hypothetical protein